ncbi:MAG: protein kinase [Gemmatimonadetes bacterium]|nr:protein kinase [Gemmatimonadota bacterium]
MSTIRDQLQETLGSGFTVERELGGGGMSRVFVATDTALKRAIVVKVLPPELVAGVNVERFRREILLAAGLQHAHIVPVLSAGETDGLPWFTMPFVDGESLRQRLARGPLPIAEVSSILRDVARALAYAHSRGVVHRDIKPDNVLISGGSAVVTDFGIAKALSASRTVEGAGATHGGSLTQIGMSIGTPAYMAPEQAAADPATDARADIYSFGCLAYELLTGRAPFVNRTPQKLLAAHMSETPQPVIELRPDTPPLLAQTVMACLEKDANHRPQGASDLVYALDLAMTTSGSGAAAPTALLGGRVRLRVALAAWFVAFFGTWLLAKAAIVVIGLPSWVLSGALAVMLLGLPMILFTAFVQRTAHRALTATPTLTPGGTRAPHGTLAMIAMRASPHVSWRRTVRGGVLASGAFVLLVGAIMGMRVLGIGPAASLFAAGKLNARDKLLVADFTVPPHDSSLAPVVSEAIRASLNQSPVLSVLSPASVAAALQRMQRGATAKLDPQLAREVAIREGAKAVVSGDLTPLGNGYIMTMRLVSADSGAELASFRETAESPKDLLPTLDKLTRQLREKAGESLKSVQGNPPLEQVTTTSLDALKKYAEAVHAHDMGDYGGAVALERQAIALDSNFAMAWRKLGASATNIGLSGVADSAITQAFVKRDHLSERERLQVEGSYFGATGPGRDRVRERAAYAALLAKYPDDFSSLISLGRSFYYSGEFARTDSLARRAAALDTTSVLLLTNRVYNDVSAGNWVEARALIDNGLRKGQTWPDAQSPLYHWSRGAFDSTALALDKAARSTNRAVVFRGLSIAREFEPARGRLRAGKEVAARMAAFDSARGGPPHVLEEAVRSAHDDAWFLGNPARAVSELDAVASQAVRARSANTARFNPPLAFELAIAYARAARPDRAGAVLNQFWATRDTTERRYMEPFRQEVLGEIALAENKYAAAIAALRASGRRVDGPVEGCINCRAAQIGLAFDRAGQPDSAIAELALYANSERQENLPFDAMYLAASYKRLGELYEQKGDIAKAIAATQKFVDLWKNADPELQPKVSEARQRLARLTKLEAR